MYGKPPSGFSNATRTTNPNPTPAGNFSDWQPTVYTSNLSHSSPSSSPSPPSSTQTRPGLVKRYPTNGSLPSHNAGNTGTGYYAPANAPMTTTSAGGAAPSTNENMNRGHNVNVMSRPRAATVSGQSPTPPPFQLKTDPVSPIRGGTPVTSSTAAINPNSALQHLNIDSSRIQPKPQMHSYTQEERRSFCLYINNKFSGGVPPSIANKLPINPDTGDLFEKVKDGTLLCEFINKIRPDAIPARSIIAQPKNHFEAIQNCNVALKAAADFLKCNIVNIGAEDIMEGKPHLVLGLIWQLVRYDLVSSVNLSKHPEIVALMEPNEPVSKFAELTPEVNLLRWFNYHLREYGWPRTVTNFSKDLQDGENYIVLLHQVAPDVCSVAMLGERDTYKRAQYIIESAARLGGTRFITPEDILNGNWKLNLAFVADLFHKRNALHANEFQTSKLREIEAIFQEKLRVEEYQMRDRLKNEEERLKAQYAQKERELEEKFIAQRNAIPVQAASQTEGYASQRRWSGQGATTFSSGNAASSGPGMIPGGVHAPAPVLQPITQPPMPTPPPLQTPSSFSSPPTHPPIPPAPDLRAQQYGAANYSSYEITTPARTQPLSISTERASSSSMNKQVYSSHTSSYTATSANSFSSIPMGLPITPVTPSYIDTNEPIYHPPIEVRTDTSWMSSAQSAGSVMAPPPGPYPGAPGGMGPGVVGGMPHPGLTPAASGMYGTNPSIMAPPPVAPGMGGVGPGMSSGMMTAMGSSMLSPPPGQSVYVSSIASQASYSMGRFPIRTLRIYVYEAKNVAKKDLLGLMASDPYVVVERKGVMRKTKACHSTRRPVWYEEFEFNQVDAHETIYVTVWDRDKLGKDDFLGQVTLTRDDFMVDSEKWYTLRSRPGSHDKVSGEIRLGIRAT